MTHIKYTTSVCPQCLEHLPAEVSEVPDGILLTRACPSHGTFNSIIETDADFYKAAADITKTRAIRTTNFLVIPIIDNCNQNCKFCFHPKHRNEFMPVQEAVDIAKAGIPTICLSGGEPTLHPELPEMIRRIKAMGKTCLVLTNGLRLADPALAQALSAAGLKIVLFSLNGFDDNILQQIDDAPGLDQKMKAIANLRARGIRIELSLSLLKGVNEGELKKAVEFCLKNPDLVSGLRLRSFARIGKSQERPTMTAGEMLALLSDALSVKKEKLIGGIKKRRFSSAVQYQARLCFLKVDGKFLFLSELDLFYTGLMKQPMLRIIAALLKAWDTRGPGIFMKALFSLLSGKGTLAWLTLKMFSWPDRHGLDLEELSIGGAYLDSEKKISGFFEALILHGRDQWAGKP